MPLSTPSAASGITLNALTAVSKSVGTRCLVNAQNGGIASTAAGETLLQDHKILANCDDLRLAYSNTYGGGRTAAANTIYVRAAVEDASGRPVQVTFNGQTEATLPADATVISDPIGVGFNNGDRAKTRTYVRVASDGLLVPNGASTRSSPYVDGVATGDVTTTVGPTWTTDGNYHFGPAALLADTTDATCVVGIYGDSITAGQNDGNANMDQLGWALRALADQWPSLNLSIPGDAAIAFKPPVSGGPATSRKPRIVLAGGVTHALVPLGVNDIGAGTAAQMQDSLLSVWRAAKLRNQKVIACTVTPGGVTSSDGFITLVNQTVNANDLRRTTVNDWIRGGAPIDPTTKAAVAVGTSGALVFGSTGHPASGYIDINAAVESSTNSGKWRIDLGAITDGTHPNALGSSTIATAVTSALTALLGPTAPGAVAAPPVVDPTTIFGGALFARYNASMETGKADGDALASIADRVSTRHLTQGTGSKKPLYKTNINYGKPVYRFDGTDDFVAVDYDVAAVAQSVSVFLICKMRSGPGGANKYLFGFDSSSMIGSWGATTGVITLKAGTNLNSGALGTAFSDGFHLWEFNGNGGSSQVRKDDAVVVSGAGGSSPLRYMTLGCDSVGNFPADIDVHEVLVVSGTITAQQRADLHAYSVSTYATPA